MAGFLERREVEMSVRTLWICLLLALPLAAALLTLLPHRRPSPVEAARRGITVVTAQGNEGRQSWFHLIAPADGDTVCAVGAVDSFQPLGNGRGYTRPASLVSLWSTARMYQRFIFGLPATCVAA